jgi:hypothetical protein
MVSVRGEVPRASSVKSHRRSPAWPAWGLGGLTAVLVAVFLAADIDLVWAAAIVAVAGVVVMLVVERRRPTDKEEGEPRPADEEELRPFEIEKRVFDLLDPHDKPERFSLIDPEAVIAFSEAERQAYLQGLAVPRAFPVEDLQRYEDLLLTQSEMVRRVEMSLMDVLKRIGDLADAEAEMRRRLEEKS